MIRIGDRYKAFISFRTKNQLIEKNQILTVTAIDGSGLFILNKENSSDNIILTESLLIDMCIKLV